MSTTGSIEALHKKNTSETIHLANQELVDYCNTIRQCGPYKPRRAFEYIKRDGVTFEDEYPFIGKHPEGQNVGPKPKVIY